MKRSTVTLRAECDNIVRPSSGVLIYVEPAGIAVKVPEGTTLMAAALQAGLRWPNVCGGQAQCGVCAVEVLESDAPVPEPSLREQQMLKRLVVQPRSGGTMRLACQFRSTANASVSKPGFRKPPDSSAEALSARCS